MNKATMKTKSLLIISLVMCLLALSCREDKHETFAPIVGVWSGNRADFKINPSGIIPGFTVPQDNFPIQLEFKNDGTVILTKDNKSTAGTYVLSGDQLTITIDYELEYINMGGTYTVETLTQSNLQAFIEKEGTFKYPDTGQEFNGKVKATLFFDRRAN
jgi:hypothetical protein